MRDIVSVTFLNWIFCHHKKLFVFQKSVAVIQDISSARWWWIVFVVWLTDERRSALLPVVTICQRSSSSRFSDTPPAGSEPVQNLRSGLIEWSCAATITTTPRHELRLSFFKDYFTFEKKFQSLQNICVLFLNTHLIKFLKFIKFWIQADQNTLTLI